MSSSITSTSARGYRLTSIDMLRGLVILIMALDHVRDFTMVGGVQDPMADPNVSPWLYFTRWITHFCAPVFILLAGVSAGLMADRKSPRELAGFLFKRGLWLILIELVVMSTSLTFSPRGLPQFNGQTMIALQTLWAIGASMVILSGAQLLGARACLWIGLAIVAGHNLLDPFWPVSTMFTPNHPWWVGLHAQMAVSTDNFLFLVVYPLLPWTGVMLLGFGAAGVFRLPAAERDRRLLWIGLAMVAAFIVLRALDVYGEPQHWKASAQGPLATLMPFLNTSKYPPSLQFLLMTLGPATILCSFADRWQGWLKDTLVMFGRVPFAFYVAHFYLAHLLAVLVGLAQGFRLEQMWTFFAFFPQGFGLSLGGVYLGWIAVIIVLYPFCRWLAGVKARRPDWWLSYL
jgi:uncharacterized membrane protein